jgi:hypothetical protein
MMDVLNGGNWNDGVDAGFFAYDYLTFQRKRELIPFYKPDMEGLPDRWVRIWNGETGWIPKGFRL